MTKLMFNQSSEEYTNSLWYNGAGGGLEMKYVRLDLAATVFLLNLDA